MQAKDLTPDERSFLIEAADFEQEFWQLIDSLHWDHLEVGLPQKYELAQSIARNLLEKGVMACFVVYFDSKDGIYLTVRRSFEVPAASVYEHWDNPHFWGLNSSATLIGHEEEGHSSKVCLELTALGEKILDEIFEKHEAQK